MKKEQQVAATRNGKGETPKEGFRELAADSICSQS